MSTWIRSCVLFFCLLSTPLFAEEGADASGSDTSANTADLKAYFLNFGAYLGYDLKKDAPDHPSPLLEPTTDHLLATAEGGKPSSFVTLLNMIFGATPVNSLSSDFVPKGTADIDYINAFANKTFPSYKSPQEASGVSISPLIDQREYQSDPVLQGIQNILDTPDYSVCLQSDRKTWVSGCNNLLQILDQVEVKKNVIGEFPTPVEFFKSTFTQPVIGQLNANALIAPLLYSSRSNASGTDSTGASNLAASNANSKKQGLTANSQTEFAANFIRYATSAVSPLTLIGKQDYADLYNLAMGLSGNNTDTLSKELAEEKLAGYLTALRVYASRVSVAYSNLYYILSKRVNQDNGSQALNEYKMATWRLGSKDAGWLQKINDAPTATVQKEIATLLAEINYQLYLSRQEQERLLLTNTMILLFNAQANAPLRPSSKL